jgi:hypothetical protein
LLAVAVSTLGVAVVAAIFLLAYGQERQIAVLLLQLIPATAYHILLVVPVHYLVTWLMRDQSNK